jgi:hypothetical protein
VFAYLTMCRGHGAMGEFIAALKLNYSWLADKLDEQDMSNGGNLNDKRADGTPADIESKFLKF